MRYRAGRGQRFGLSCLARRKRTDTPTNRPANRREPRGPEPSGSVDDGMERVAHAWYLSGGGSLPRGARWRRGGAASLLNVAVGGRRVCWRHISRPGRRNEHDVVDENGWRRLHACVQPRHLPARSAASLAYAERGINGWYMIVIWISDYKTISMLGNS